MSPSVVTEQRDQKNLLERALGIFTEVRAGEGYLTFSMAFLVFLLMGAYYLIRPMRKALILEEGTAKQEIYLYAVMAFLLYFLVQGYAKLVSRYERTRLISVVTTIFIGLFVFSWLLGRLQAPYLGYLFYVWTGIFSVMVVAQFWSYANDVYSSDAGKRLFPLVGFGGMLGALFGSDLYGRLADYISVYEIMLVSAGILAMCILITNLISLKVWGKQDIRVSQSSLQDFLSDRKEKKEREKLAFGIFKEHKYLWYIALMFVALNMVNTTGEFILSTLVEDYGESKAATAISEASDAGETLVFKDRDLGDPQSEEAKREYVQGTIGVFYASFYRWQNLLGLFLQLFVVARLVKWGGIRAGLLWLPIMALGTYTLAFALPILKFVRFGKVVENASDYSINKTTMQMLFLPTSRDIKYKAKQVIDSFFQRVGDVASSLLVFVGTTFLGLGVRGFAFANLVVLIGWFFAVRGIVREHREIEAGNRPELTGELEEEQAA